MSLRDLINSLLSKKTTQPIEHIETIDSKPAFTFGIRELISRRELLYFFVRRELQIKYKQTLLGATWILLVPLIQMLVFTVIFGYLAKVPTDGANPSLFYLAGIIPWNLFSTGVNYSSLSLMYQSDFLTKVYFPRLIIPLTPILASAIDLLLSLAMLLFLALVIGSSLSWTILLYPLVVAMVIMCTSGIGLFLAAVNVRFRDVRFVVPFLLQIWMYASLIFPYSSIPSDYSWVKTIYLLNPMAGAIELSRRLLLNSSMPISGMDKELIYFPIIIAIAMFLIGLAFFKYQEKKFADII